MVFVSAMAPIKSLFTCLLTVVSLPQLKAWAPSDINCRRLVPLQLTSVVTPCVYPCILLSPYNGHGEIVLRHEVDGTPCKIPGSESFTLQISKCVRGLCYRMQVIGSKSPFFYHTSGDNISIAKLG
ncbi:hypothetical protein MRX96_029761 [Rhipicephalus microplus]